MTEVTPSCDIPHNPARRRANFRNFLPGQTEVPMTGGLPGAPKSERAGGQLGHKTLRSLYQTLRPKKRNRGFNKRQRHLSRRNENEVQFLETCCGASGRGLVRLTDDRLRA